MLHARNPEHAAYAAGWVCALGVPGGQSHQGLNVRPGSTPICHTPLTSQLVRISPIWGLATAQSCTSYPYLPEGLRPTRASGGRWKVGGEDRALPPSAFAVLSRQCAGLIAAAGGLPCRGLTRNDSAEAGERDDGRGTRLLLPGRQVVIRLPRLRADAGLRRPRQPDLPDPATRLAEAVDS